MLGRQSFRFSTVEGPQLDQISIPQSKKILKFKVHRMLSYGNHYENYAVTLEGGYRALVRIWFYQKIEATQPEAKKKGDQQMNKIKNQEKLHHLKARKIAEEEGEILKMLADEKQYQNKYFQTLKGPSTFTKTKTIKDKLIQYVYIPMDYYPNGNLKSYLQGLQNRGEWLSLSQFLFIFNELISMIACLHNVHQKVHRNLNLSNICFDLNFDVKLTDFKFGFGQRQIGKQSNDLPVKTLKDKMQSINQSNEEVGSVEMLAPEIARISLIKKEGKFYDEEEFYYNQKVDIYHLGTIIYYLIYGDKVKRDSTSYKWIPSTEDPKILELKQSKELMQSLNHFLKNTLHVSQDQRWSATKCLKELKDNYVLSSEMKQIAKEQSKIREKLRIKKNKYRVHIKKMYCLKQKNGYIYVIILSNKKLCIMTRNQHSMRIDNFSQQQAITLCENDGRTSVLEKQVTVPSACCELYSSFMKTWIKQAFFDDYAGDQTKVQSILYFEHNTLFVQLSNSVVHHCFINEPVKSIVSMRLNRLKENEICLGIPDFNLLKTTYQSFREAEGQDRELLEYIRSLYQIVFREEAVQLRKQKKLILK